MIELLKFIRGSGGVVWRHEDPDVIHLKIWISQTGLFSLSVDPHQKQALFRNINWFSASISPKQGFNDKAVVYWTTHMHV